MMSRSAEVGGGYCAFSWKVPHFSQTFIMRGRLMITWAQISSPPHWHVPTLFRAAPWRASVIAQAAPAGQIYTLRA